MAQTVSAPKKATIRGYDHELAYIMPHEELLLKMFGGGTRADGSQKYGPNGIKSFDPGDGQGDEGGNDNSGSGTGGGNNGGDTAGHGGMSVDPGIAASVTDMNDPFGFGGFFGGLGITDRGVAMSAFGTGVGIAASVGDRVGAIAAEAGLSVDEPTGVRGGDPNAFGGGDQGNDVGGSYESLMSALTENPGLQTFTAPNDYTKRVEGADNLVTRQRLFEIYQGLQSGMSEDRYNLSAADQKMLTETLGQYSNDNQSINWGSNIRSDMDAIRAVLESDQFQASVVDRDFGKLKGFNKTQADKYRDFDGDFGSGGFAEFIGANGYSDQVNADMDVFFGENDDLNKQLAQEFDFEGAFGDGRFWADIDARGVDRNSVNSFIDAYNGVQPVSSTDVYPIDVVSTDGDPTLVDDSNEVAPIDRLLLDTTTPADSTSSGWNLFDNITIPEIDWSSLDMPENPALSDQVASSVGGELDQDAARNDILSHIRNLPRRSTGGTQALAYDIGGSGINFL